MSHTTFECSLQSALKSICHYLGLTYDTNPYYCDFQVEKVLRVRHEYPETEILYDRYMRDARRVFPVQFYVYDNPPGGGREARAGRALARYVLVSMITTNYDTETIVEVADRSWCSPYQDIPSDMIVNQRDLACALSTEDHETHTRLLRHYDRISVR